MSKADEFTAMLMALQGVTVLEAPRVSRETIIQTLRDHTLTLRSVKQGLSEVTRIVTGLASEAADNRRVLQNLADDNKKIRGDVETLYRLSDEFRTEMNEFGEKVAELYSLKAQVKEHRAFVDDLANRFEHHTNEIGEYRAFTDRTLHNHETRASEIDFRLRELKDYVEHFADNLILPSSQITVEASAGYDSRPKPLLEVLKTQCGQMVDAQAVLKVQGEQILANQTKIETKADDFIVHEVKGIQRKVTSIENHILKEEEQGIGAIRRQCDELVDKMQGMTTEMADKMDRREVAFIVHEKYEEIVKYLQDALQSSTEDENNFKAKADEIQTLVLTLNNTKADRVEIAPMQEILVKTEAMLKRMAGKNAKDKDTLTRKEVEALLELKVDKSEFESQLSGAMKGNRKTKRLAALAGGAPASNVTDEAAMVSEGAGAKDRAMWKGIADAMKDESEEAILRAAYKSHTAGGGSSSDFAAYILAKKAQTGKANPSATVLPTGGVPGQFRQATEGGRAGGYPPGSAMTDTSRPNSTHGYAAAFGQPGGPSYPIGHAMAVTMSATDPFGQQSDSFPHVPPQKQEKIAEQPHDMSFLGAQVAGGGFNQRNNSSLRQGPLKGLGAPSSIEDVEGLGLMLKGADSKLYYTDTTSSALGGAPPIGQAAPTSKPAILASRVAQ